MLKKRILATLKFFDLQDMALTLLELQKFLLGDLNTILPAQDQRFELVREDLPFDPCLQANLGSVLTCLENECQAEVKSTHGYYYLNGREEIVLHRLENNFYGVKREKRIRRFLPFTRHLPFIRGVAIGGSQALGIQKKGSDIDLLVLVKPGKIWLTRIFLSAFFQIFGLRRHGKKIANLFCLNHYVNEDKILDTDKNLYTAMEYLRLRPLIYAQNVELFLEKNKSWIALYFPNMRFCDKFSERSAIQIFFERVFNNSFGEKLESFFGKIQKIKIRQDEYVLAMNNELSFHPQTKKKKLLEVFFKG